MIITTVKVEFNLVARLDQEKLSRQIRPRVFICKVLLKLVERIGRLKVELDCVMEDLKTEAVVK